MYYEDNVKVKIDWKGLIIKLIAVVLLILVFIWLFPMPKLDTFYSRVYNENLNAMKSVAEKYFVNDNLPANTGTSNTIKLQEMIDKKLITEFTDKNNNECSTTNSFAQVTKTENDNYVLKIQLSCDDKTDYVLETLNTSNNTGSSKGSTGNSNTSDKNNSTVNNNETSSNKQSDSESNTKDEDDGIEIDKSIINSGDSKYDKGEAVEYEYKRAITKTTTSYTCPDGYIKDGNTCYRYDTGETIPATPLYFDDEVVTTEAKKNTSGGYYKYADAIKTESSREDICPEGYTKNGNICYKYVNATIVPGTTTYSCPDGYTLQGKTCVTTAERIESKGEDVYTCPEGYTLIGKTCVTQANRIENKGKDVYYCPEGYVLNGTTCTSTVIRIENKESDSYTCPSGYVLNGSVCTKTIGRSKTTNYNYSCPSGYSLSSDKSRCTRSINATRTTTPGTTTCTCPSGYKNNGSNCSKQTTYTGSYHAGTTTVTWTNPQYISSKTQLSEYNNGTTRRTRNGSPSCGASGCTYYYKVETAVKKTTAGYYTCNDGKQQSSSTCYTTTYANKNCTTSAGSTYYSCPSGYSKNGTTCTQSINSTRTSNNSYSCPSGYYQSGNSCIHTVNASYHRGSTTYTCPSGYNMSGTRCVRTTNASKSSGEVTYSCPSGYYMKGTICEKVVEATPHSGESIYSCPSGYSMKGTICEKTIDATPHTSETEYTCPSGYIKKGTTCYQYTETTTKINYMYTCPEGYTAEGSGEQIKCSMYIESKTSYYCENADEALVGTECVKKIKGALKGYTCPDGYILNNDTCIKHTFECTDMIAITNTSTTYEYKWSTETSIDGWTQTGKTRNLLTSSDNLYEK